MSSTIISTKQIVKIVLVDDKVNPFIEYQKERKFLGITFRKAGFYSFPWDRKITSKDLKDYVIKNDNKVFYKPLVKITLVNGSVAKQFDNIEEALKFIAWIESKMCNGSIYRFLDLDKYDYIPNGTRNN